MKQAASSQPLLLPFPRKSEEFATGIIRFCWLRDATYTLYALLETGFTEEAKAWGDWLLRAVAGSPDQMQIMYGVAGERRLTEIELRELPGY